jgi:hypothetical protein
LYNAGRQERIDAYRLAGKSIGFAEQCKSLTKIRRDNAEYWGAQCPVGGGDQRREASAVSTTIGM